jgi:poly(3-hydroxybutyrate) depolymerase
VIALHSLFHTNTEPRDTWGLEELAQTQRFAVAYPDGLDGSWNAGTCCGSAVTKNVDDVGWLRALISNMLSRYPIDPHRVYLVGFSNGGMLAYRYACEHGDEIAGIGVVAGSLQAPDCDPPAPVTVVTVHGLADQHVPYDGTNWSAPLETRIASGTESLAPFRLTAGCPYPDQLGDFVFTGPDGQPPPTSQANAGAAAGQGRAEPAVTPRPPPPPPPVSLAPPLAIRRESACTSRATVVEYLLPQLGHGWPTATGPDGFDTANALWSVLADVRSAIPSP